MIKMIVTDVDGTIVGKDEVLHEEMISYVKALRQNHIYYTIATGRTAGLIDGYVKRLEIDIPYIACNGGMIVEGSRVLVRKTVPLSGLRAVFEMADSMGMSLLYSVDGIEYAYRKTPYVEQQQSMYGRYLEPAGFTQEQWDTLQVDKVIVMAAVRDGSIGVIEELLKALPKPFGYKRYANKAIDILHEESTKEGGLRELAKRMNIRMEEILFAGDDLNDMEAIREAGVGVAVGNAQPPAKEIADYVAEECCYLGVMEAVDRYTGVNGFRSAMDNSLRRQSYDLPGLLNGQFDDLKMKISGLFRKEKLTGITQVILTGCGDSYAAGLTLRYALEELIQLPVDVPTVIDFSRCYRRGRITESTLVVIISVSGNGARIREAVEKANSCHALTLAVTKNRDSDIGRQAKNVLQLEIPPFEGGPGNRTYFVCVLALLLLGIHMGRERNVLSEKQRDSYEREIRRQGELLQELLPRMEEPLFELAKAWKHKTGFDFVGSGMEYGSAWFGHAKIIEITGAFTMHINSEEWFHMNNFVKQISECVTIFIVSTKSPGFSRSKEAVNYCSRLGRPMLVITDGSKTDFGVDTNYIEIPSSEFAPSMALTQYVPVCILAGYMGAMLGEKNCRGCLGPWKFAAGGAFIRGSERMEYD